MERDEILRCDDDALSARCELLFCRGSGPGGQKRNKSSSAARVRLTGTAFEAEDCTERSQHRNRANALRKLRMKIALSERRRWTPFPRTQCAYDHPEYPLFVASLLDALAAVNWEIAPAATLLAVTPTALLKTLSRDAELWQTFCARRRDAGLTSLRPR
ncbi:MAG: hypothetical protein MJ016_03105 [Victivallaceae bacterium]|nr:hypothetical protein [Victivallaceae bacterium]